MIPDYQSLMKPVLELAALGEIKMADAVSKLEKEFGLTAEERSEMLPSGKQTRFANRVHWARSYLKQAGLIDSPARGIMIASDAGKDVLASNPARIDAKFLENFPAFIAFKSRTNNDVQVSEQVDEAEGETPDEAIRKAHAQFQSSLAAELLGRVQNVPPTFFEAIIVRLLLKMGYGHGEDSGEVLGASGDDGVDGVINLDPLGVDQVYVQAKRYKSENIVGSGAIRDFYGALGLKDVSKGIFVTTSSFSKSAKDTAEKLGARIVLIDGPRLAKLLLQYEIGCRVREVYEVSEIDEGFFE